MVLVKEQLDDFIEHLRDNCSTEEDNEIKGIFNAIETFLDANCDKGQLISKCSFGVFKSTKKSNEIFVRISALASKKRSNQKSSVTESK